MPELANMVFTVQAASLGQVTVRIEDDTLDHDMTWTMAASTAKEIAAALNTAADEAWIVDEPLGGKGTDQDV